MVKTKNCVILLWSFTIGLFVLLTVPGLVKEGMFFDGTLYAAIAHNMSLGIGSFWKPFVSVSLSSYNHPPLAFWLESLLFRLFGDHLFVERLYSFFTGVFSIFLLHKIWSEIFYDKKDFASCSWYPVFLWLVTPVVCWSYRNNMLENTLTIFILFTVLFQLKALRLNKVIFPILSGICTFLAFLVKGPVGLFPLTGFLLFGIVQNRSKKTLLYFLIQLLCFVLIFGAVLMLNKEAHYFFKKYLRVQIIPYVGHREGKSQLYILGRLVRELIPMLSIGFLLWILFRKKRERVSFQSEFLRTALSLILIGLSGSLPFVIARKQSGFYLVPALSIFALGIGVLTVNFARILVESMTNLGYRLLAIITLTLGLVAVFLVIISWGKIGRDRETIQDVKAMEKYLEKGEIVGITSDIYCNWQLHAYMARYHRVSLVRYSPGKPLRYFITLKKNLEEDSNQKFKSVVYLGQRFILIQPSS